MKRTRSVYSPLRAPWVAFAAALVLFSVVGVDFAVGQEQEPTPAPTPAPDAAATAAPAPTPRPALGLGGGFAKAKPTSAQPKARTLGGGLGSVKPAGSGDGKPLVIDNANLGAMGQGGAVSQGSGSGPAPAAAGAAGAQGAQGGEGEEEVDPRADWEKRYRDQEKVIQDLEERLRKLDEEGLGLAHHVAPGVKTGRVQRRERLVAQIEAERAKLTSMRREGRGVGVNPGFYRNKSND